MSPKVLRDSRAPPSPVRTFICCIPLCLLNHDVLDEINFTQNLHLFKDSGRTPFEHTATYSDNYTLNWVHQSYAQPDIHKYAIKLEAWQMDFPTRTMEIHGLSVWSSGLGTTILGM